MKKIIAVIIATLMLLITVISAVRAAPFYDFHPEISSGSGTASASSTRAWSYPGIVMEPDRYPSSASMAAYSNIPVVTGPYPRYYFGLNNYRAEDYDFAIDDFHHFDSFEGYRDLDVYYPERGYVDILRNPDADITMPEYDESVFGIARDEVHIYGMLPNGAIYKKHYYHDHPTDCGYENCYGYYDAYAYYDYGCPTFTPITAYRKTPIVGRSCMPRSICDATHENCCD